MRPHKEFSLKKRKEAEDRKESRRKSQGEVQKGINTSRGVAAASAAAAAAAAASATVAGRRGADDWEKMASQKPVEWVSSLIMRFEEQVRCPFAKLFIALNMLNDGTCKKILLFRTTAYTLLSAGIKIGIKVHF